MISRSPSLIGARVTRVEDARLLTGRGRYVADLDAPGAVHVAFVRSPHAAAHVGRIDVTRALAEPGVVACLTAADLAPLARPIRAESRTRGYRATDLGALASGVVRHQGEAVAAVVAESRYVAEDAADLVGVDWEPLPAVTDPRAAAAAGPFVHADLGTNVILEREFRTGEVEPAFRAATLVVADRFRFHRHAAIAMENRACLAAWDTGRGDLTLHSTTQIPGMIRDALADILDLPGHRIRVVAPDVGGGFGMKTILYPEEVAVAAIARRLGRPVKWIGDRREDLLTSSQAWDEQVDAELAVDGVGHILGLRATVLCDVGAYSMYPWTASIEAVQVISFLPGPYRVPAYRGAVQAVATNKAPMGPYRGVGRPVSAFVVEGLLDRAARRLQLDPGEIRRRNFVRPDEAPYRSASGVVWDTATFAECLERACRIADYEGLRRQQQEARAAGRSFGIGIASYVELTGVGSAIPASPGADISTGTEGATVRVDASGTVTATFAIASQGQGHETTLAQVVAGTLGARLGDVRVVHGDTAAGPIGSGTYASRTAVIAGGAAVRAAEAVRDKALVIAAHLLEASASDLDVADGVISVRGAGDRRVTLREVARAAYAAGRRLPHGLEPGLEATRYYDPYFGTASGATHIAVVEIDRAVAAVRLHRYVIAEDCGRVINPLVVEGQTIGGLAQGVGAALLEEVVYDGGGQLLTGTLLDYLVPMATDMPPITVEHLDRPSPSTLGGFRGVGEGGTIGAPAAIANAVSDALAPLGIEITELPITPERLFQLLAVC
ncbi:MAG: xanthine dehydrogenase family protein [Candidatus Rokubacteria bacterium]|nr:xanthine dehydrogenase family protein [Candidatus Rokubacteria bacterium]